MAEVYPPDHLQMFVSLLLDNVPHEPLQLVVLVVPGREDLAAGGHDLLELLIGDVHQTARTQDLITVGN